MAEQIVKAIITPVGTAYLVSEDQAAVDMILKMLETSGATILSAADLPN